MTTNKFPFLMAIAILTTVYVTSNFVNTKSVHSQDISENFNQNTEQYFVQNQQTNTLNLTQNGQGSFNLQGRPNRNIKIASVTVKSDGKAEIAVRLTDGSMIRFGGKQIKKDAYSLIIKLTNSGMADATGVINVEYGANNSINNLFGDGTLDGQQFVINFNN